MSNEYHELKQIERLLLYEAANFGNTRPYVVGAPPGGLTIDQVARAHHAALLERQKSLKYKIRLRDVTGRWTMRKFPRFPRFAKPFKRQSEPLTPMGMDEVIWNHRIVDDG